MKKRFLMLLLCGMCAFSMVACNSTSTKNTTTKKTETTTEKKSDDTSDTTTNADLYGMTEDEYIDYMVNETIRNQIMSNSPDVVKHNTENITNDSFVTLTGVVTNSDGTEESFNTDYRKVSDLSVASKLQEDLLQHKEGDVFDSTLPTDNGDLSVKITVKSVTDDPLNYFTDDWVKTYSGSDKYKTTDEYEKYVRKVIVAALDSESEAENGSSSSSENSSNSKSDTSSNTKEK